MISSILSADEAATSTTSQVARGAKTCKASRWDAHSCDMVCNILVLHPLQVVAASHCSAPVVYVMSTSGSLLTPDMIALPLLCLQPAWHLAGMAPGHSSHLPDGPIPGLRDECPATWQQCTRSCLLCRLACVQPGMHLACTWPLVTTLHVC